MSEGHGDPGADVRSFLPRPGEPVEQYAERLRSLHRDLTLVLQAVERGLAAAAERPDPRAEPGPAGDTPIDVVPVPQEAAPPPPAGAADRPRSPAPRVEVLPPPTGAHGRHDGPDRRADVERTEPPPRFARDPVEPAAPRAADTDADPEHAEQHAAVQPGPAATGGAPPRPAATFPARPSAAAVPPDAPPREPEWVERDPAGFTPPTFPPVAGRGPGPAITPALLAALAVAWLVVVGLLVALLVS